MPYFSRIAPLHGGGETKSSPMILNVPGLSNSGPQHWQTRWEQRYPWFHRAALGLWDNPDRSLWIERLDAILLQAEEPVILVAHSLGCQLVAWWAASHATKSYHQPVVGALLVAPVDPEQPGVDERVARFGPVPHQPLPFPSILVASRNDAFARFDRSIQFAAHWGSRLVDAGEAGHLNADSGLGDWPLGLSLVDQLSGLSHMPVSTDLASISSASSATSETVAASPSLAFRGIR